ncbi:MAG: alanine:cation symporter family protein, partial [Kiritimatiellae bacterium]|nr:alanine:cation symporter family protein [Kiritimatiellia bacterium]
SDDTFDGYFAPLAKKGSKLRLVLPEERVKRRLEEPQNEWDIMQGVIMAYRFLYIVVVAIGPYLTVSIVWGLADVFNGLMAFPNLVALIMLSPEVWKTTKEFLAKCQEREHWIVYE